MIYDYGTFVGLSERLARDFGKVYYYSPWKSSFPQTKNSYLGKGLDNVERVNEFYDYIDDVDLIVFPDVMDGDLQLHLESLGCSVFGCRKGEELELNRLATKKLLKKLDLPIGNYEVVKGLSNLRKYLKEHKNVWVKIDIFRGDFETFQSLNYDFIEPRLYEIECNLGPIKELVNFACEEDLPDKVEIGYDGYCIDGKYPSKTLAGIEIKDLGYIGVFSDYNKLPEPILEVNKKLSPILKNYGYRGLFSTEVRIGKDHKGYLIDPCCFSDDTEILTDQGWKYFKDLNKTEKVVTLNTETKEIEYQLPYDYIQYEYNGKMIHLNNRKNTFDCLVTPNHEILRYDRHKSNLFKERADSLTDKGYIPRSGMWNGIEQDYFEYNTLKIKMDIFLEFFGWYISEGSRRANRYINISQIKTTYLDEINILLSKLGLEYKQEKCGFYIKSKDLVEYLDQFGLCNNKFVPEFIKQLSSRQIRIFLDAYRKGDGSIHKGTSYYYTTSKQLADDMQELILKCNKSANIIKKNTKGTEMCVKSRSDKIYIRNYDIYQVTENRLQDYWFETGNRKNLYINEVDYNGIVYCLTVPNHTVYIRRNGKAGFNGQCRAGSPPNEVYQEMYTNLSEIMWEGARGNVVDPIVEHKYAVEVLIHSVYAETHWLSVQIPDKYYNAIKFRNCTKIDNIHYIIPQYIGLPEIGAVTVVGDTIEECTNQIDEIAEEVKGYYIDIPCHALEKATEEIDKLKNLGYDLFK